MQTRLILRHWRHLLGAVVALSPVALVRAGDISSPATENKETVQVEKTDSNPLSFWDGRLIFDLEERVRWEIRNNNRDFDASKNDDNDDNWFLNRFRLGLAVKPVDWLKLYGQTQDNREWNSDRSNIPGVRGAEGDDAFDLRQAYVAIGDIKQFPLVFTAGRQSITYGDSRLVADSRWNNFGRTFDALRLRFEKPDFWVEAFAMRPVQIKRGDFDDSDSADNFFGIYASTTALKFQTTDFYVFYRDKSDNQPDLDPTNKIDPEGTWNGPAARFVTIGARVASTPDMLNGWDYNGEAVYENGHVWASNLSSTRYDLSAFAVHAGGGYTFRDVMWKPRVGITYDFASGDHDPHDHDSESFQNLFPSNHDRFGLMDEDGWRNIHDLRFEVNIKPVKKLSLDFRYHAFWLADTSDYWYRSNGISTLRTTTPDGRDVRTIGASNFAGQESDVIVSYDLTKNVKLQTGYAHFFAGQYLVDTGPHSDADFGFVMTTFLF
jgi:Alginate export